jgi:hypothetical protein
VERQQRPIIVYLGIGTRKSSEGEPQTLGCLKETGLNCVKGWLIYWLKITASGFGDGDEA